MKRALIIQGGWEGHEPALVAERFRNVLKREGFDVEVSDTLDSFLDGEKLKALDLIVPIWTMGQITKKQVDPVLEAVASGVGIAGCHGGMCDSFRDSIDWQFMTGGQWVAHPGGDGVGYRVDIHKESGSLLDGIEDFMVSSEQYYMHVDPAVNVLATTDFPVVDGYHVPNGKVAMPVVWTKYWGLGRVFYTSLGHHNDIFDIEPAFQIMKRGLLWAAAGKSVF